MKYVNLGTTGLQVSELCLGTMTFGKEADPQASAAIYRRCREAGINFFDCANVYTHGESERILGGLIAGERDRLILTSKVGSSMGEGRTATGCHAATSSTSASRACGGCGRIGSTSTSLTASTLRWRWTRSCTRSTRSAPRARFATSA